jgi:hypothetical protein
MASVDHSSPEPSSPRATPSDSSADTRQLPASGRINGKDVVALMLSAAALVVSVSTLYVTQFRITSGLHARFVEIDSGPSGDLIGRFVVSNSGSRPVIVLAGHYMLSESEHESIRPWDGPADPFNPADRIQESLPVILPPREVRLLALPVPKKAIVGAFEPPAGNPPVRDVFLAFRFLSIDADGERYDVLSPSLARIEVTPTGWRSLAELRHPRYAPLDLFSYTPLHDPRVDRTTQKAE